MDGRNVLIWLSSIQGVGYGSIRKLMEAYPSMDRVWTCPGDEIYKVLGKTSKAAVKIVNLRSEEYLKKVLERVEREGLSVITILDGNYPDKLKKIYDPPFVLYYKGKLPGEIPTVGIVGARNATPYGKWAAKKFARELTDWGVGIISGLALGIDTESHRGALENGGYTLAVLGSGIDIPYPVSNSDLMEKIGDSGCVLSEFFLGEEPLKHHFPQRNRIISALSDGLFVIEAGEKSGSLITVEYALEHGKDIFALPGNINCEKSKGTNRLIKEGAKMVLETRDILEELTQWSSLVYKGETKSLEKELSEEEIKIYQLLKKKPMDADELFYHGGISIQHLNMLISSLELKGYITRLSGKTFTVNR